MFKRRTSYLCYSQDEELSVFHTENRQDSVIIFRETEEADVGVSLLLGGDGVSTQDVMQLE